MDKSAILQSLRDLTSKEEIALEPLLASQSRFSVYSPINKYVLDVTQSKPESAAEDLFRSLITDVLGLSVHPQVRTENGFADFAISEGAGEPVLVELKPLFDRLNEECLRSIKLKPAAHLDQIKKYLRKHEYVILTDLRDAYLYNARDTFVDDAPFLRLPCAELLERALQTRSLLDTLRRAEDEVEKPELDRIFFDDLQQWFNRFREVKFTDSDRAAELVILLINKIVFAKTLEDYGLVPFRFIQDEYENQKERWVAKGAPSILRAFLRNFEEFFDDHYDTELFETKLWDLLDKNPDNLGTFARALDDVLGIDAWSKVFRRGIVHYNYRRINEDIFGKSYEMFLAANRKDEGIYYTPAPITAPMANSLVAALVAPLVDELVAILASKKPDYNAADTLMARLSQIRIVDMAGGSGGFLIKVLRALWEQYQRIAAACAPAPRPAGQELFDVSPGELRTADFRDRHLLREPQRRDLVAAILLRHVWCVDKDAGALEVAKTNIWKEAVKLSPPDYNFRLLREANSKILPNLELNFLCADSLVDVDPAKQVAWLAQHRQADVARLHALRDQYVANPSDHDPLADALALRAQLRAAMQDAFKDEALPARPLLAALSFFPCYFTAAGKALPAAERGFDGNIGNPPWEAVKPFRKEFARVGKFSIESADVDAWFEKKLKEDADFRARWEAYVKRDADYAAFCRARFQHQGGGDLNLYKLFLENNLGLVKQGGQVAIFLPSGIQTDEGSAALRKLLVTGHTLLEITSFENRGYIAKINGEEKRTKIFPDVHPQFKFGYLRIIKGVPPASNHAFNARFYLHDPSQITTPPIPYRVEMMTRFSPENFSIMEFIAERDYELCRKIRSDHALLGDAGHRFHRELDMTNDSRFFKKRLANKLKAGELPLYEGKMVHQFDSTYAPGNYYVVEKAVRDQLLRKELHRFTQFLREAGVSSLDGKELPGKAAEAQEQIERFFTKRDFRLHYEFSRVAYRAIGRSTDERTLIAAMLKPRVFIGNSLIHLIPFRYALDGKQRPVQVPLGESEALVLLSLFNSLTLNYYMRNKVSANLNMFYLYELPVPKLADKLRAKLVAAAEKLLENPHDTKERAKLEVLVARDAYGLDAADWQHLTGTFTYGSGDTKAELDEIIARSIELW
jgi:type I restriction-modification system DNA methylase subunit